MTLLIIAGCGPNLQMLDAKRLLGEAKEYQDAVNRAGVTESIAHEVSTAQRKYVEAEQQLAVQEYQQAIIAAQDSITASKRIILKGISYSIKNMKAEIIKKQDENPASPLGKILPKLEEILLFADQVQGDNKGLEQLSLVTAASITTDLRMYEEDIKSSQQEKLQSDISFALGKYDLAQDGKIALEKFADKIVANVEGNLLLFRNKQLILQIDVYGFTDSSGFLSDGGNRQKRMLLNQRLSELRAKSVSDFLHHALNQKLVSYAKKVSLHPGKVVGKGEELPAGIPASAQTSNPQRRVCQIFSAAVHDIDR
jgi:outer membrane protein OmpA-like peptidoglycan-associated protein